MKKGLKKPRVLVSACLLGRRTRWDGSHAKDGYVAGTLGRLVEWIPVCPEAECGLPVPREPMDLKGEPGSPRLIAAETGRDLTETLKRWTERRLTDLQGEGLCGMVFKSGSPSCGVSGIKVHGYNGSAPRANGTGIFARAAQKRFPLLPAADEKGLREPAVHDAFMKMLYAAMRWRDFLSGGPTLEGLREFHALHELLVKAHDPKAAAALEKLIKAAARMDRLKLLDRYGSTMMAALRAAPSASRNAKVLSAVCRRVCTGMSEEGERHVESVIEDYRAGRVPLLVPLALMRHYIERAEDAGLKRQFYFNPYPRGAGLRA